MTLDFGNQFPGADRWLEIGVRTNGGGAVATLSPRQQLTSTPYALRAANATTANSAGSVAAANITGTIPLAQLPPTVVTNGASGVNISGTFSGNGAGVTNVDVRTLSQLVGTVAAWGDNSSGQATIPAGLGDVVAIAAGGFHNLALRSDGSIAAWGDNSYGQTTIPAGLSNVVAIAGGYQHSLALWRQAVPAQVPLLTGNNAFQGSVTAASFSGNGGGLSNLNSANLTGPLSVSFGDPVNIGHTNNGGLGLAYDIAVSGNYAYLANLGDGLRVYDISNPANPLNIGHINTGWYAYGVVVSGNYAYVANTGDGLRVYDISNPANPVNTGHANDGGYAYGVAVSGNYAFLANGFDGLRVYDISNPTNLVNIGHTNNGGTATEIAVSGNYAYLANNFDGLRVYDISNPTNLVNIGHTNNGGTATDIAVSGNYAFLANGFDGLRVYDISNPTNLVNIAHIYNGGYAYGVAVSGNYAYLANYTNGLRVYDISNPANPVNIGHINNGGVAYGVAVSGNYAYLANYDDGLRVYALDVASADSFRGDGSGLTGLNASQLTSGTVPGGALAGTYSNAVTFNNAVNSFTGNGSGLTSLNASQLTSGTVPDARLSANVALLNAAETFTASLGLSGANRLEFGAGVVGKEPNAGKIGYQTFTVDALDIVGAGTSGSNRKVQIFSEGGTTIGGSLTVNGALSASGNVGIGTTTPARLLQIGSVTNTTDAILRLSCGNGTFLRTWDVGVPYGGTSITSSNYDFVINDTGVNRFLIDFNTGNVGIGTNDPAAKLQVIGDVKLGNNGQYFAPGGEENLRILRGSVTSAGAIVNGSGFTATRNSLGHYTITFSTGFSANPTVTVSCGAAGQTLASLDSASVGSLSFRRARTSCPRYTMS